MSRSVLLVENDGLQKLNARPNLFNYVEQIYQRRHFIFADAKSKTFSNSRDMFLGRAWVILKPLLEVSVYVLVFGLILKTSRGIDNFVGYLVIGVIYFGFIASALSSASGLIQSSKGMISSFSFPKAALGVSLVTRQIIDHSVPAIVAILVAFAFQWPKFPNWTVIMAIPLFGMIHIFSLGAILVISRITAFIPDTKALVGLLSRALFFTSGVFFSIDRFDAHPTLMAIVEANPVYLFLKSVREVTIYTQVPSLGTWLYLFCWTFGLLAVGLVYFWQAEERYPSVR